MNLKSLEKSKAIYKQIVELDGEIIKINKKALSLANSTQVVELSLSFNSEKEEPQNVLKSGSFGNDPEDYINRMFSTIMLPPFMASPISKNNKTDSISFKMSETECLSILGVILSIRQEKRRELINSLKEMGFQINQ